MTMILLFAQLAEVRPLASNRTFPFEILYQVREAFLFAHGHLYHGLLNLSAKEHPPFHKLRPVMVSSG